MLKDDVGCLLVESVACNLVVLLAMGWNFIVRKIINHQRQHWKDHNIINFKMATDLYHDGLYIEAKAVMSGVLKYGESES